MFCTFKMLRVNTHIYVYVNGILWRTKVWNLESVWDFINLSIQYWSHASMYKQQSVWLELCFWTWVLFSQGSVRCASESTSISNLQASTASINICLSPLHQQMTVRSWLFLRIVCINDYLPSLSENKLKTSIIFNIDMYCFEFMYF